MNLRWLFLLLFVAARIAPAQAPLFPILSGGGGKTLVTPSLVADTAAIAPGKPFTVGVRISSPGLAHLLAIPGDSGAPPKIEWQLPPGFKAGPIQWPIPHAAHR